MSDLSPALLRFGNVAVRLSVELGRVEMPLRDVLALGQGSVVPLNRLTDELLDITANGKVVAQGEVIAQDGRFAMRIVSLVGEEAPEAAWPPPPMQTSVQPSAQTPAQTPEQAPPPPPSAPADGIDDLADALAEIAPGDAENGGTGA
ncbi:MAG: FliM/FliN family flagellar motor switch protein [Erythrobacter sp.]|jgi:flagellar motor switch protein FliN/FliY|nr:FliM/FliN family flagellar motor switch protein [Erythrobacter sp.]